MHTKITYSKWPQFHSIDNIKLFMRKMIYFGTITMIWILFSSVEKLKTWLQLYSIGRQDAVFRCLVHPGIRDKRRVSKIDLSQPRHETAFWWRHNEPVTSQSTDPIKWPNYPLELIRIYVHINTHNKDSLTQRCRKSTNVEPCLIFLYISIWFES